MEQTALFKDLKNLKENDWFKKPSEWRISQWYIIGVIISDLSLCSGMYAKRWASELKILNSKAEYLICGNKDEIIILFEYLCKNNKIPMGEYLIFKVLGNKVYNKVDKINLSECDFKGTRKSEIHFHIFLELKKKFIDHLLKQGFLFDTHPNKIGVYEKHLPIDVIKKLREKLKWSLLAGLFDGDGSIGATIKCPNCSKLKTLRRTLKCPHCKIDVKDVINTLDYFIVLDSRSSLLDEEIIFLKTIMNLKGHLYLHLIKKEFPTKDPKNFNKKIRLWDEKIKLLKKLEKKYTLPLIFHENILKKELPSFNYAPDISGSMRFRFSPFFRKKLDRIKWYGVENLYEKNIPILLKASKYMIVKNKVNIIKQFAKNKNF